MSDEPYLIKGGKALDDRGSLKFTNDFDMAKVRRYYIVENYNINFIRAWHAHKIENKYVSCINGSAKVCAVKIDNFDNPDKSNKIHTFFLDDQCSDMISIPCGYANGFMSLEYNTKLVFFSDKSLNESLSDDFRYPYDFWDPWKINFR